MVRGVEGGGGLSGVGSRGEEWCRKKKIRLSGAGSGRGPEWCGKGEGGPDEWKRGGV